MSQDPNTARETETDPDGLNTDADVTETAGGEYEPSSELTDAQNADLKKGKLPREIVLELLQTIVGVFAIIMALVAVFLGIKALSLANDNAQLIEQIQDKPAVTKQLGGDKDEAPVAPGPSGSDGSEDTEG